MNSEARLQNSASSDDVGRGEVYKTRLIQAQDGPNVAPPWFAPALAAGLAPWTRIAHVTYNLACGDGRTRSFKVVPFLDGTLPTMHPHNLPPLTSIHAISALTGPDATSYLNGYGLPYHHQVIDRQNEISMEIGCTAT